MAIFIFSAIKYMAGTKMSVRKVAKLSPKIMVQESGPPEFYVIAAKVEL
jgi:hypothetical protein